MGAMITMPQIDTADMLTTSKFAEFIDASADTVKKYCQRGVITGAVKAGHSWLIPKSEVAKFQRSRRKPGRPPKVA